MLTTSGERLTIAPKLEVAEGRSVDRVHRRAGGLGRGTEGRRLVIVLGVDQRDRRAREVGSRPHALDQF